MKRPSVKLHIEELVLHGFAPGDRYAISDALERELSHLFALQFHGRSIPPSLPGHVAHPHLDAGAFQVAPGAGADSIGAQIARALHGGLTK